MTTEEKAKYYDEAKARISKAFNDNRCTIGFMNEIFPELAESEDEKIRKELISFVRHDGWKFTKLTKEEKESWIAWLEKQTEEKSQGKSALEAAKEENIDNQNCVKSYAQEHIGDKVEPKFKVGDWIVVDNEVLHIKNITDDEYITEEGYIPFRYEEDVRLWTIQDANDGDVLVCPKYAGDIIPNIFIFKNFKIKDNDVFCYCSFLKTFETGGYIANADPINTDFYPATKEQCDLLFQKMKEAGYEWDIDNKKLRKIEQKPVWNKEDERIYRGLHNLIYSTQYCDSRKELSDFLDSLKDRVQLQPQAQWKPSDEQMDALVEALSLAKNCGEEWAFDIRTLYEQLKKLREGYV